MAVLCGALAGADHEAPNGQEHGIQLHPRCRPVADETHPEVTSPSQWTHTLAQEYVAAVDQATVGGWSANPKKVTSGTLGKPFKPRSKSGYLSALRGFFRDLQEWGLAEIRFDVRRAFRLPEPIRRLIGPDPRIIDQIFWAKLLQAGLCLTDEDVLSTGHNYPAAMVRAVAIAWLFCGIRRDEIGDCGSGACTDSPVTWACRPRMRCCPRTPSCS
jgi:hypothetical protein